MIVYVGFVRNNGACYEKEDKQWNILRCCMQKAVKLVNEGYSIRNAATAQGVSFQTFHR